MERREFLGKGLIWAVGYSAAGKAFAEDGLEIRAFTANYSKTDLNGNGILEGDELKGEGTRKFGINDRVSFGANVFGTRTGDMLKFRLYDGKGNLMFEKDYEIRRKKDHVIYTYEAGQLKEGSYKGIWSMQGKKDVKCEIEVKR